MHSPVKKEAWNTNTSLMKHADETELPSSTLSVEEFHCRQRPSTLADEVPVNQSGVPVGNSDSNHSARYCVARERRTRGFPAVPFLSFLSFAFCVAMLTNC